jgi:RHH-type rel operon transcriptional repressor/antitoxin RelB
MSRDREGAVLFVRNKRIVQLDVLLYLYSDFNMLAIRLPDAIEKRLSRLAKLTGRTKTFYAREAIQRHLEDLEDLYLAEKRLKALRSGRSRAFSLDEVERDLGVDS